MTVTPARDAIRLNHLAPEAEVLERIGTYAPDADIRTRAVARATKLIEGIRGQAKPGLMEVFLAEYGLSTREGIALMCLAEALLRVPDAETIDALIEDKIAPSDWGAHLGHSSSSLVNASTWALMLTGRVLQDGEGLASVLRGAMRRVGEPVIRTAVRRAMAIMGRQFVLGETIGAAIERGKPRRDKGFTYSYDMLGEAAMTAADAAAYYDAYADAIRNLSGHARAADIRDNPGISIKLSALHPRYEEAQRARVMDELVPRVLSLAEAARDAGMGLNIDAEEADRLEISLDVIERVLAAPSLAGWDGFGVVVQAYGKRALPVIEWLYALAERLDRKIMVRLVKGAYWDTEIKRAQVDGVTDFPVFTRKPATDVSYICCAARLLQLTDRIYPQFATHNAHSVATILEIARDREAFEFQRLHGMGEALHDIVHEAEGTRCRIYAPVGAHRDLLAYLVRRLLENGANSSFVNQITDASVPAWKVGADPFEKLATGNTARTVVPPMELFAPERPNSRGTDLTDRVARAAFDAARESYRDHRWQAGPMGAFEAHPTATEDVINPASPGDVVGTVSLASEADIDAALTAAAPWSAPTAERRRILDAVADAYEAHTGELCAILAREAGKTPRDAIAEIREAVDFLRYYGAQAQTIDAPARGIFTCISPWNFPLAIFSGQIAAALATGNAVLAKPAETTPLVAARAVELMWDAGVPKSAVQLMPGAGSVVGAALTSDPRIEGVSFTGSTATAHRINRSMAGTLSPTAPLIAETGGLNAMIVDSTALPEQAVRDIVISAFQSAGQRCSALRMLYVQEDVADTLLTMLQGAMDALSVGDPWEVSTDSGPVIDSAAKAKIDAHIAMAKADGRLVKSVETPETGFFVAPSLIRLPGIGALEEEIFGPVLHVATFKGDALDRVIDDINAKGYGLTFGLHSRIDDRVEELCTRVHAGNIYVNRNQIGAIVGSQPFGGEGLSGTGPKAGGPQYLKRFVRADRSAAALGAGTPLDVATVQRALDKLARQDDEMTGERSLPGPTGESNRLRTFGRGVFLCLGPKADRAQDQASRVRASGAFALAIAPGVGSAGLDGVLTPETLGALKGFAGVICEADDDALRPMRKALAEREGAILPLLCESDYAEWVTHERHICIDTTASGGNAALLAAAA